jgi:hypothetical protein
MGFKIEEEKQDARIAFLRKLRTRSWLGTRKNWRTKFMNLIRERRNNILDSISFQNNARNIKLKCG